ncbi:MAG: hypothetical protein COA73_02370 [Candidatus Hydrogenedentota bacterium]|nr:MAG: hypothetical protein COA73_02370 [Candidatus Hydrogenedentota bacterium]
MSDHDFDSPLGDSSGLFDAELRDEIVNKIHVETVLNETDISVQLREQRIRAAGFIGGGLVAAVVVLGVGFFGIKSIRAYIDANTFIVRAEHYSFAVGDRYTYAVSQDGEFLLDSYLVVEEEIVRGEHSIFRVELIAPGAMDTYYWSVRKDGFYQFLSPDDAHPQVYIPFPMKSGKKWKALVYPSDRYSYAKQAVNTEFRAGKEMTLQLPYGEVVCIEITVQEPGEDEVRTLWIAEEAPIARLVVDPDDPSFVAELKSIDKVPK